MTAVVAEYSGSRRPRTRFGEVRTGARHAKVWVARATRPVDWPLALTSLGLTFGLLRGWVEPALHQTSSVFDLGVVLPGTDRRPVSWGIVLLIAVIISIAGQLPVLRRLALTTEIAAVLAVTATIGFLIQSCLSDQVLQNRLSQDELDLSTLQRIAGFTIPRPRVTTLGPIPLPSGSSEVFSALRSGFYVAAVAAVALALIVVTRHRRARAASEATAATAGARRSWPVFAVAAVMIALLAANLIQAGLAQHALNQGRSAAAGGDDAAAVKHLRQAISRSRGLANQPDVVAEYGLALIRQGASDGPEHQLAASRQLLDAGRDLAGLQTVGAASSRWPANLALREEFVQQGVQYLIRRGAPQAVHRAMPGTADSPVLRLALARYEIVNGDNPSAIGDALAAIAQADDTEIRSIGLTFLSIAQTRSGDPTQGRQTLLAAVDADKDYVNVMARSLLTGLYTTLPL